MGANEVAILIRAKDEATKTLKDVGDTADKSFGAAEKSAGQFGRTLGDVGKIAGGFVLGNAIMNGPSVIGGFVGAASDMNETLSKSNTVFGANGREIEKWASGAARDFGQSKQQALEAAGSFGNMFVQLGMGTDEAAKLSMGMVELASDFASFHNADITEVLIAQQAAFRGEYDALQRFVPTINAASVEQKALAMTGKELTSELTMQEKALAVQAIMMENAGAAAGDFDRTAGGLANQQRQLTAEWNNAQAQLGAYLIPALTLVIATVLDNKEVVMILAGVVTGVLVLAFTAWAISATAAAVATIAATAPVIAIGVAIVALIAILVLLVKNWDDVTAALGRFVEGAVNLFNDLKAQVTEAITSLGAWLIDHWKQIVTGILAVVFPPGAGLFLLITHFGEVKAKLGEVANNIKEALTDAFNGAKESVANVFGAMTEAVVGKMSGMKMTLQNAVADIKYALIEGFQQTKDWLGRIWDGVVDVIKWPINQAIGLINRLIGAWNGLSFGVGGGSFLGVSIPRLDIQTPDVGYIPYLAQGGIVTKPTLAVIGEAGPEAVIPLNRAGMGEDEWGGRKSLRETVVNVYIDGKRYIGEAVKVEVERSNTRQRRAAALHGI